MIRIDAVFDKNGVLRSCKADGHAGAGPKGADIVCAAVSVLMRAAFRALSNRQGITVRCEAPRPGFFFLEAGYTAEGRDFLAAAGVFLAEGLMSLAEEYPEHCKFNWLKT